MKFTIVKEPIPFLIIDDTYNEEEQVQIIEEINFLSKKLRGPSETGTAIDSRKVKKNTGIFIDEFYSNRDDSLILKQNRKLFSQEVLNNLCDCHYAYNLSRLTTLDSTLLSYYNQNNSYFPHWDVSVISFVTWFFKEPKNFTGGEFIFSDFNLNVEVKNNRTIAFFSSYVHEVTEVSLIQKTIPFSGRFSLSTFCKIL